MVFAQASVLAFLSIEDVTDGAHHMWDIAPLRMQAAVEYFDRAYVLGGGGRTMFPPQLLRARHATVTHGHMAGRKSEA